MDQENMTADIGALAAPKKSALAERPSKKSRSKSIGPGGLDALRATTGNRRKVRTPRPESTVANVLLVYGYTNSPSAQVHS